MPPLTAFTLVSFNGYINDNMEKIDWHTQDEEIHAFMNDLHARFSDHNYNEACYKIMKFWKNPPDPESMPQVFPEYTHLWQKTPKPVIAKRLSRLNPVQYTVWPEVTSEGLTGFKQIVVNQSLLCLTCR